MQLDDDDDDEEEEEEAADEDAAADEAAAAAADFSGVFGRPLFTRRPGVVFSDASGFTALTETLAKKSNGLGAQWPLALRGRRNKEWS